MKKISIGIDFSKKTFDATITRRDGDSYTELAYSRFDNDLKGFRAFEKWVRMSLKGMPEAKDRGSIIFCGEHTGTCSIPLCDYLAARQYFMWLESALVIHRKCGIVRDRNDRVDSRRIAEYALRNFSTEVRPYEPDSKDLRKLKSLYAAHSMLTKDKVARINQLKSGVLDACQYAMAQIEGQPASIRKALRDVEDELRSLLAGSEEFAGNFNRLNTFKGVGVKTIAYLIIKTRNFLDFTDSRELGCYVGVVPHKVQSGTSVDRPPHTSRYRDREGNALLSSCVMSAIRHRNPIIRPYYDRLIARGVLNCKAMNNCKFKIINILLAMIRNRTEFSMDIHGKSKAQWQQSA